MGATITKRELSDSIARKLGHIQVITRDVIQAFLNECVKELAKGNRLEFRDFGVFETVMRAKKQARNPKTGEIVTVPPKMVVKFKPGRLMKKSLVSP
ncbi:MAG TPA: HU family DNA-binding protein [Candidatus Brocadiia bacterium]|nr:HU family DNA-binding protein [Candidatus Brocadiales bacterium]